MNPTRSTNVRQHEESRSARNEDHDSHSILRSRTEEERLSRRREWQRQQERERQHERLKQQKILEYERRRAQSLGYAEPKSLRHSRSKSSSKSPQYRGRSSISAIKSGTLFEKLEGSTSGKRPLFKGPEGIQINTKELRRIKVYIRRNIPVEGPIPEVERNIVNAEDVTLERRDGEGSKPIFDREEIKKAAKINEVEERRTVVAVDGEQSVSTNKSQTSKKHSIEKHREYKEKYTERVAHKYNTNRSRSRERDSRKSHTRPLMKERSYRDRYRDRSSEHSCDRSSEHSRERRDRDKDRDRNRDKDRDRDRSSEHSRDRLSEYSRDRSSEHSRDRSSEHSRDRSSEHSRERRDRDKDRDRNRDRDRDRDSFRERRDVAPPYIEPPIHVPIYYNLPPRPIVASPMVPFRGQVPPMGIGQLSALMASLRPFPPRFIPPDMYRLRPPPPNSRYGPL